MKETLRFTQGDIVVLVSFWAKRRISFNFDHSRSSDVLSR